VADKHQTEGYALHTDFVTYEPKTNFQSTCYTLLEGYYYTVLPLMIY